MKTTLEISDALFLRAKSFAQREQTTLRALTEEGLTKILDERQVAGPLKIKPVTFKGKGLSPEFQGVDWPTIRDTAYGMSP
jgi:hypothetical protein